MVVSTDFGQFISEKRKGLKLQSREFAEKLDISSGYLCQIERGKRVNPNLDLLKKMIEVLELNADEISMFYDLYEKISEQLSPDIVEYVKANNIVKKALRKAQAFGATDKDWNLFIDSLNK